MSNEIYAIVLCGGSGSRLWPRSRSAHPKHLLQLNGGATLVQDTVKRLKLPLDHIYCLTEESHAGLLRQQLPDVPEGNIIVEPGRRGTASATILGLLSLKDKVSEGGTVVVVSADHLIQEETEFDRTFDAWIKAAEHTNRLISIGITPTYPSTGFGYINLGKELESIKGFTIYETKKFVEKPDEATAKKYVDGGDFLWNASLFAAPIVLLEAELRTHMPREMKQLDAVIAAQKAGHASQAKQLYLSLPEESIDYGLLEKSDRLGVIPASFTWADVGSWADLHDVLERDADGNVFEGEYVDIDTRNCFVYSPNQLVATIGVENLVIINTPDAVLICPKDRSQDVKKVVQKLKADGLKDYL